jgi:hypothetical protein
MLLGSFLLSSLLLFLPDGALVKDFCLTCNVCYEDKYLIETYCNHRFCLDCLIDMNAISDSEEYDEKGNKIKRNYSSCSFCRENIEFTPID